MEQFLASMEAEETLDDGYEHIIEEASYEEPSETPSYTDEASYSKEEAAEQTVPEVSYEEAAEDYIEDTYTEETQPAPEPEVLDKSMVGTTGFAQCGEYLNVRSDRSTDSEVVGKISNNGSLEILDVAPEGWYLVRSGNVEGYVAAQYVAIGEAAQSIAATSGYTTAQVGADVLNVRASASGDSEIIATVEGSQEIEVVEDQGEWIKVILDGEMYGYVSADYVYTSTAYATGETLEEEEERLNQQWLDYLAQQEAEQAAAEAAYLASLESSGSYGDSTGDTSYYDGSYTDNSASASYDYSYNAPTVNTSGSADELAAQANNLYQEYLNAQAAADAAVANGEGEQAILESAAAAQAAYETFVHAQNAADNAAAGLNGDGSPIQTASTSTASYESSGSSAQETPAQEAAPAVSSAGQAIANYACQFVGNPYVYGGASLTGGADCSGFTMAVMANFGIGLPHNAAAQSGCGSPVSLDALQPGDLLFYNGSGGIGHVSIYIGNGQVVHASNPTNGILISSIGYRTPVAARRFV